MFFARWPHVPLQASGLSLHAGLKGQKLYSRGSGERWKGLYTAFCVRWVIKKIFREIWGYVFIPFGETRPLRAGFFKIRMGPSSKLGPYPLQSQALRPGFTASGNQNDEAMYIPTLERMRKSFNTEGFLFCGDSKISTKTVLESVVKNKEFYLCPLQFRAWFKKIRKRVTL